MDAPPAESSLRHGEALQAKNHKLAKELVSSTTNVGRIEQQTNRMITIDCCSLTSPRNAIAVVVFFFVERMSNETSRRGQERGPIDDGECT